MKKSKARQLALEKGEKFYIPETPCKKGHILRRSNLGECVECKRVRDNISISSNRIAYNLRKKRERVDKLPMLALKAKEIRANETLEETLIRRENSRIRSSLWRLKNPYHENSKLCKQTYKRNNIGKTRADSVKRKVSKMHRTPKWTTETDIWMMQEIYSLAILRSKLTGITWHVDHIIPLQGKLVSGLHTPENLQVIPGAQNIFKGNKFEVTI